ncbi:MAG: histidinol dehydrogenase [Gammaproteobacteria bacterium]|nr:histidinol dehydrogenase [Gammaproteobacteria bacterium]
MKLAFDAPLEAMSADERRLLLERRPPEEAGVGEAVAAIVADVRARGDDALRELAREHDRVELDALEVPRTRWRAAARRLPTDVTAALERAAANIAAFHRAQLPADWEMETEPGVVVGRRWVPLAAAGVYAPGGLAAYPSSVLMGVIPAREAGVGEVVVCSPPGPKGEPPGAVLAACALAGASRLFAVGGAGAVAAMAYGTESVPAVDAVVGPGNRWVTEAKRQVAGDVVIDAPAGPSEIAVVADGTAPARLVALEMAAQAEHDPDAAAVLITPSARLAAAARRELRVIVAESERRRVVGEALAARGAIVLTRSLDEATGFARAYAPEHLALYVADPDAAMEQVPTAGTVFLGPASSVAFGDYMTGANHVLPTGGLSRSYSSLSADHFVRSFTWQRILPEAAASLARPVARLARLEGLPGHAETALARITP